MQRNDITNILLEELKLAMGCTEPAALAFAAAKAAQVLEEPPIGMKVLLSPNIIKNAKAVSIPNSEGMRGIKAALALGALGGDPGQGLAIFSHVREGSAAETKQWLKEYPIDLQVLGEEANLKIDLTLMGESTDVRLVLEGSHDRIAGIWRGGEKLTVEDELLTGGTDHRAELTLEAIFSYVEEELPEEVKRVLRDQLKYNSAISEEGLLGGYGLEAGLTRKSQGEDVRTRAVSAAAAGSDARMGGCALPVVINYGSGNQGITLSVPVLEYAREYNIPEEEVLKSLCLSNLLSLRVKSGMGKLSAFCGAVSAATAAAGAICYMMGGSKEEVYRTIINTLGNTGGIVCDGAKGSCAIKIVSALDSAFLGYELAKKGKFLAPGEGIIRQSSEETLDLYAKLGLEGMKETDALILQMMLDEEESSFE